MVHQPAVYVPPGSPPGAPATHSAAEAAGQGGSPESATELAAQALRLVRAVREITAVLAAGAPWSPCYRSGLLAVRAALTGAVALAQLPPPVQLPSAVGARERALAELEQSLTSAIAEASRAVSAALHGPRPPHTQEEVKA